MTKPTLFIPGLPGSDLHRDRRKIFLRVPDSFRQPDLGFLRGPDDLAAPDPVRAGLPVAEIRGGGALFKLLAFFVDLKRAESLYDILRGFYPPGRFTDFCLRFGWDWRRPVWDLPTRDALAQAILDHSRARGRLVIIAHSTGGLVLRNLLEDTTHPRRADVLAAIERIIAFGVPWGGLLKTFESISGQRGLPPLLGRPGAQATLARSWAAFDLLPPEPRGAAPELPVLTTRGGNHVSPLRDRGWHPPPGALRDAIVKRSDATLLNWGSRAPEIDTGTTRLPITNVVGWGFRTTTRAELVAAQPTVVFHESDDGDNTVPRASGAWLQGRDVRTFHLPIGRRPGRGAHKHIVLWGNEGGRNLLAHHVAGQPLEPFVYATVDIGDHGSGGPDVRVRCVALRSDGSRLARARVRFRDPRRADEIFDPTLEGRHTATVPRSALRQVGTSLRILELEITWQESGQGRSKSFRFFVAR